MREINVKKKRNAGEKDPETNINVYLNQFEYV